MLFNNERETKVYSHFQPPEYDIQNEGTFYLVNFTPKPDVQYPAGRRYYHVTNSMAPEPEDSSSARKFV
jgi:hypothetical protein